MNGVMLRRVGLVVSVVVAVAVAITAGPSGAGAQAGSSGASTMNVVAVAGNGSYLVYKVYPVAAGTHRQDGPGKLYLQRRSGHRRLLATVTAADFEFSLAGHTLAYVHNQGSGDGSRGLAKPVTVINLKTRIAKHFALPPISATTNPQFVSAAPGGFLYVSRGSQPHQPLVLHRVAGDGSTSTLGDPFPGGALYAVAVSARSYVAFALDVEGKGAIRVGDFATPGAVRTLLKPGQRSSVCGAPSRRYVACWSTVTERSRSTLRVFALRGGVVHNYARRDPGCDFDLPVVEGSLASWLGCAGAVHLHLQGLTATGSPSASRATFAPTAAIGAFGEAVLRSRSRTRLVAMTTPNAVPQVIATAG